jgi:aminoglycoside phosphotransferase (APT) family kinase protein
MTAPLAPRSAVEIAAALREAGVDLAPGALTPEQREGRLVVALPGDRLAWFPTSDDGRAWLARERRVLRVIAEHCSFAVPRVIHESPAGWDVRARVPGRVDPWAVYHRLAHEPALGSAIGAAIGAILAEQHGRVPAAALDGLPLRPGWPLPDDQILAALPEVTDAGEDADVRAAAPRVLAALAALPDADRVLVHGDLGLHNLALDPDTDAVRGVFDYGDACLADRHRDFRYLVFDVGVFEPLEAALAVYEPATGVAIDRGRVLLENAGCALSFLADRRGHAADARPCGRTLAEDLRWVRGAIARLPAGGAP